MKRWTDEEVRLLKDSYNKLTNDKLIDLFDRSFLSIYKKARSLGIYRTKEIAFQNRSKAKSGANSANWKGGRKRTEKGYVLIYAPNHHRASKNNKYIFEHILLMEKHLGRKIKINEVVHHINGIKDDNNINNLQVMGFGEHSAMHNKSRKEQINEFSGFNRQAL